MTNITKEQEKEEHIYSVYIHTNKANNKVYIGITSKEPKKRWRNGEGYYAQRLFYNAIKKYGWKNFTHKILYKNLTKEEAAQKEKELIAQYKANSQEYGYNVDKGGFDIDSEKLERMRRKICYPKEKVIIYSFINNKQMIFENIKEAAKATGLKEQYIKDCCNKYIINKYYDISYLNTKIYERNTKCRKNV